MAQQSDSCPSLPSYLFTLWNEEEKDFYIICRDRIVEVLDVG